MSQNQWNIGVNAYIWQRSIDYSMNNAQEGDAQKQTNLMIWMHLSQKNHFTTFDLRTDFLLTDTQKGRQPYLF